MNELFAQKQTSENRSQVSTGFFCCAHFFTVAFSFDLLLLIAILLILTSYIFVFFCFLKKNPRANLF